jgi:peroxiredoxin
MSMTEQEREYNTPDFWLKMPDMTRLGNTLPAQVGQPAPAFEVQILDGETVRLQDLLARGHVVLMMGSITSPMCAIHVPMFNRLAAEFGDRGVQFFLVYTKESHPGENYLHHTSLEQKISYARDLRRLENVQVPILVDNLAGSLHRSYGPWPTSAFGVHRDGRLVFRTTIVDERALRLFVEDLVASERLTDPDRSPHISYTEMMVEHEVDEETHYRVYVRAGPKAFEDYWKVFPGERDRWPRSRADRESAGNTGGSER